MIGGMVFLAVMVVGWTAFGIMDRPFRQLAFFTAAATAILLVAAVIDHTARRSDAGRNGGDAAVAAWRTTTDLGEVRFLFRVPRRMSVEKAA